MGISSRDSLYRYCIYIRGMCNNAMCNTIHCRRVARILFRWVVDGPFEKLSIELSVYNISKQKCVPEMSFGGF